jgi:hypothetical protein
MDVTSVLVIILIVGAVMLLAVFIGIIPLAAFIYVWTTLYPYLKMVGKFAARPFNLVSLVVLYVLLLAVLAGVVILLMNSSGFVNVLLILLLLLLLVPLWIIYLLLWLALVVWIVRLFKWVFTTWRIWLVVNFLRFRTRIERPPTRIERPPARMSSTKSNRVSSSVSPDRRKLSRKKVTSMNWTDRLMIKMLGNKLVIKILSIPIVLKVLMRMTQIFVSVTSRFKRKKEAAG